jgi:hypothetical protein
MAVRLVALAIVTGDREKFRHAACRNCCLWNAVGNASREGVGPVSEIGRRQAFVARGCILKEAYDE